MFLSGYNQANKPGNINRAQFYNCKVSSDINRYSPSVAKQKCDDRTNPPCKGFNTYIGQSTTDDSSCDMSNSYILCDEIGSVTTTNSKFACTYLKSMCNT